MSNFDQFSCPWPVFSSSPFWLLISRIRLLPLSLSRLFVCLLVSSVDFLRLYRCSPEISLLAIPPFVAALPPFARLFYLSILFLFFILVPVI